MSDGERSEPPRAHRSFGVRVRLPGHQVWLIYAVLATFVVLANHGGPISAWKMTQWWFSYDLGFVKRGLMGTLLEPLSARVGYVLAANLASTAILAITAAAIVTVAAAFTVRQRGSSAAWLVSAALITMPGSIAALSFDYGRYDGVLVLILIGSTWATWRIVERPGFTLWAALVAAQVLGVLVHEIHLLIAGPVLLAVLLIRWSVGGARARTLIVAAIALTVVATIVVGVFGRVTAHSSEVLLSMAATELPFTPDANAILVLTRSLSDNLAYALARWSSSVGIAALVSTAFGLLPLATLVAVVVRPMGWLQRTTVVGSALAPLTLAALGVDIGRWATFASLNAVLVTMVVMEANRRSGTTMRLSGRQTAVLGLAVLIGATLGGFAITLGIPSIARLVRDGLALVPAF